ncbi:T9SS type A sorting domain-containing protein [Ulvibacter litoralis]|nr:T9SS type A sorting domain-containing protein [Ulvibacter litoralis]
MKRKLLFLSAFIVAFSMNAQYTVEDHDGNPIVDGDVVSFGSVVPAEATYEFYVNNTSTTDAIRMKIEFVNAINADGSQMELCFGLCYTGITIGQSYPPNADFVEIAPGAQTLAGNHMLNVDPGNGTEILDYIFRFYQINTNGDEIGEDLTMTYRYDPLLSVNDASLNVNVMATSISEKLVVSVEEALDLQIYDLQGRVVVSQNLSVGTQEINVSDLTSQMYLAHFKNNNGVSQVVKIMVN